MFTIIMRDWTGVETIATATTLESAIATAEKLYTEEGGDKFTDEESIEVWEGKAFRYMACGE
jgi:hypothetical protein